MSLSNGREMLDSWAGFGASLALNRALGSYRINLQLSEGSGSAVPESCFSTSSDCLVPTTSNPFLNPHPPRRDFSFPIYILLIFPFLQPETLNYFYRTSMNSLIRSL